MIFWKDTEMVIAVGKYGNFSYWILSIYKQF